MRILIVAFFDDNYGDMLIRICFKQLLKVSLFNLKIKDYIIDEMPLKEIKEEKIKSADIIIFSGGGLFGISYLDFANYLEKITKIAEKNNIPVIFSSVGVNNMSYTDDDASIIKNIWKRKCIKYISVRENPDFFKKYISKNRKNEVDLVCDPAVWTKYVYHLKRKKNKNKCIGINVVRGGLFKSNNKTWLMQDEYDYLNDIKDYLESKKLDYKFYTNGSFLDDNALLDYKEKYSIPDDKILTVNTTKEFVNVMKLFDATVCIRMHSSIVSYALDIPSINIVWNDKLRFFYKYIGQSTRLIEMDNYNKDILYSKFEEIINDKCYKADEDYLMTLYNYLFKVMSNITMSKEKCFKFKDVVNYLNIISVSKEEDDKDILFKLEKSKKRYLSLFNKELAKEEQIKKKNEQIKNLKQIPPSLVFRIKRKLRKALKKNM